MISALLVTNLCSLPVAALAQEPELLVTNEQIVRLSGSSPSLRAVVQQLCGASGVDLRQYDAEDRPFAGNYQDIPLSDLLPRLLRAESHAVGLRAGPGSTKSRIAWLRVIGKEAASGSPHAPVAVGASNWTPPNAAAAGEPPVARVTAESQEALPPDQAATIAAALLNPAFTEQEDQARSTAINQVAAKLNDDINAKIVFGKADPGMVARSLAIYPDVRSVFAMIQSAVHDPEMKRQLNSIAGALNGAIAANLGR